MRTTNLLFIGLTFLLIQCAQPARILGFFSTPGRSHFIIHESLMRELAARGHDVTVITPLKQMGKPMKNYRYIHVNADEGDMDALKKTMLSNAESSKDNLLQIMPKLANTMTDAVSHLLNSHEMALLKKEKFDLVVFGWFLNDFQIGLAAHFNAPSVIISVVPAIKLMRDYVGNPAQLSSVPSLLLNMSGSMTFKQRLLNVIVTAIEFVLSHVLQFFVMKPLYAQHFPSDQYPSYDEMMKNVSLVLINQHFSQGTPTALVPGMIEFSGMHVKRKPDPLPEEMQQWLDSAPHGAILFSMGSNVKSADLSLEKREEILRTFAKLKQRILWKFEEDLPNKPDNVMISKWLPQDDVLAHPNIKLFISHCGKGGLSEAKYHGVPVLGIPLFGDQQSNVAVAVSEGWAHELLYSNLNEQTFTRGINEILNNPKYGQVIKGLSTVFRDRPQHPLENAAFWVEYVLRHNGAKHLQSPAVHLNFFQYYSLDVVGFLFITFYLTIKITKRILKRLFRLCCGSKKTKTD